MPTIRVHTTQNVTIEYEAASIGDRIVATLLDYLVLIAWGALMWLILYAIGRGATGTSHSTNFSDPAEVIGFSIAMLLFFVMAAPIIFYNLLCEVFFNGQSVGKKARNLRVVRLDGTAPRLGDYFLRWLLCLVEFGLGYGLIAVIAIAASGKGQRLGDMAAGTTVISTKPRPHQFQPGASQLTPADYEPVFPQAADLTDHDASLLRQLLNRSLQQDNYLLLNETAVKIKGLLHVESNLSDEEFLRTVLRDHAHLVTVR